MSSIVSIITIDKDATSPRDFDTIGAIKLSDLSSFIIQSNVLTVKDEETIFKEGFMRRSVFYRHDFMGNMTEYTEYVKR